MIALFMCAKKSGKNVSRFRSVNSIMSLDRFVYDKPNVFPLRLSPINVFQWALLCLPRTESHSTTQIMQNGEKKFSLSSSSLRQRTVKLKW